MAVALSRVLPWFSIFSATASTTSWRSTGAACTFVPSGSTPAAAVTFTSTLPAVA